MNQRLIPLPPVPPDALLTRDELARVLGRRDAAKLLRGPFRADPDACPARVAMGLLVLAHVVEHGVGDLIAMAVAEAAMQADPTQQRYLVGGWRHARPAAVFVAGDLLPRTESASDAAQRAGVTLAGCYPISADVMFLDLLGQLAWMRAQAAAPTRPPNPAAAHG